MAGVAFSTASVATEIDDISALNVVEADSVEYGFTKISEQMLRNLDTADYSAVDFEHPPQP